MSSKRKAADKPASAGTSTLFGFYGAAPSSADISKKMKTKKSKEHKAEAKKQKRKTEPATRKYCTVGSPTALRSVSWQGCEIRPGSVVHLNSGDPKNPHIVLVVSLFTCTESHEIKCSVRYFDVLEGNKVLLTDDSDEVSTYICMRTELIHLTHWHAWIHEISTLSITFLKQ